MMKRLMLQLAFSSLIMLSVCFANVVQAQTQYRVVDLGTAIPNSVSSRGLGINSVGNVVLSYDVSYQGSVPAVWNNGTVFNLPIDGNRAPTGIDQWGNVVGTFTGNSWGWIYRGSSYFAVPDQSWLSPDYFYATSRALAINDVGVFTGAISGLAPPGYYPAFTPATEAYSASQLTTGQIVLQRLGKFNGQSTIGWGINEFGHVVGAAGTATQSTPVLFRDGQIEELPRAGGPLNRGEGINNAGFAVGFVSNQAQSPGYYAGSGAVWDVRVPGAPQLTLIGQLQGSNQTWLYDINDSGIAIGRATLYDVSVALWVKPVTWTASGGVQDLNGLLESKSAGWQITDVRAINASGQIVGTARFNGSLPRAVRLDPQQGSRNTTKKSYSR